MLQITEWGQLSPVGSPCPVAPLTRQQQNKGQAGARDNRLLAFNRIEKSEIRLINWKVMRMINGKNLESKEQEKGMKGETNQVFEGTLSMQ